MRAFFGDNGLATAAILNLPRGIALDSAGNLYVADDNNSRVRKVDAISGIITTIATVPAFALAFDPAGSLYVASGGTIRKIDTTGAVSTYALGLGLVRGMQFDSSGNLYFCDGSNRLIRRIDSLTQVLTTVAGNGNAGYSGDGGPATSAAITQPEGIAIDPSGSIYFSDFTVNVIRKITGGTISTYAGGAGPEGVAPTSGFLNLPEGVTVDSSGALYISDSNNGRIRRADPALASINTVAGLSYNSPLGTNGPALSSGFDFPIGIAFDPLGNLFVADDANATVRRIDGATNMVTTIAGTNESSGYGGDNGPATSALLAQVTALALDPAGTTLYIADLGNQVVRAVAKGR